MCRPWLTQSQATRSWNAGGSMLTTTSALAIWAERSLASLTSNWTAFAEGMVADPLLGQVDVDVAHGHEPVLRACQLEQVGDQEGRTLTCTEDEDLLHVVKRLRARSKL